MAPLLLSFILQPLLFTFCQCCISGKHLIPGKVCIEPKNNINLVAFSDLIILYLCLFKYVASPAALINYI